MKPLEEFHRRSISPDGHAPRCKPCYSDYCRVDYLKHRETRRAEAAARYSENPDPARQRMKDWVEANPERAKEQSAKWRRENPDRRKEITAKWRGAHKEQIQEANRAYHEANKEAIAAYGRAHRARPDVKERHSDKEQHRRSLKKHLPAENVKRSVVWTRDGGVCHICGKPAEPANWHLEHIIPLARGGHHVYDNVAVSHPSCNLRKARYLLRELGAPTPPLQLRLA
jgi:5-methylcytosine-specific restriction endonuclease McrA